jgi:hypothetical protein
VNVPWLSVEFQEQVAVVVPEVELALELDELLLAALELDELAPVVVVAVPELDELLPWAEELAGTPPAPLPVELWPVLPLLVGAPTPLPPAPPMPPVPPMLFSPELQAPVPIPMTVYNTTTMPERAPLKLIESPEGWSLSARIRIPEPL